MCRAYKNFLRVNVHFEKKVIESIRLQLIFNEELVLNYFISRQTAISQIIQQI